MITPVRTPLSRTRVAVAALELGDSEGYEAITMRAVGKALGVEAMSLYNHVANKEDLLDAVGDLLYSELMERHLPDADRGWEGEAWDLIKAFYDLAMEHPKVAAVLLDRPIPSLVKVSFLQQCFDIFRSAGMEATDAALAFGTVSAWLTGTVRAELGLMRQLSEQGHQISREDVPAEMLGAVDFMDACISQTPDERLAAGFATLMAGLQHQLSVVIPS
jgi:AcrR family transcriptional regulator